jgi:hypothetical protein
MLPRFDPRQRVDGGWGNVGREYEYEYDEGVMLVRVTLEDAFWTARWRWSVD